MADVEIKVQVNFKWFIIMAVYWLVLDAVVWLMHLNAWFETIIGALTVTWWLVCVWQIREVRGGKEDGKEYSVIPDDDTESGG